MVKPSIKSSWRYALGALLTLIGVSHGARADVLPAIEDLETAPEQRVDVVVVGAGVAGLSAAVSAAEHGASVMVIEKMPYVGGNSIQSAGYMLAYPTDMTDHVESANRVVKDMVAQKGNREMLGIMMNDSSAAVRWLRSQGADLVRDWAEHPFRVSPASSVMVGEEVVKTLLHTSERFHLPIQTQSRVTELLRDETGVVYGVAVVNGQGRHYKVKASSVVLATGGFAAAERLTCSVNPSYRHMATTNLPSTLGDGMMLAEPFNAALVNMRNVYVHATTLPLSNLVIPKQAREEGAILLSRDGERFCNELATQTWRPILEKSQGQAWLVMDQGTVDKLPILKTYARYGYFYRANDEEELARYMHAKPEVVAKTIRRYRTLAGMGDDRDFNRPSMRSQLKNFPLYVVKVQPALHYTPGGLKITPDGEVVNFDGKPIQGLFAAGEATGGVFGRTRPEGAGLTDAVVFGRRAGEAAAAYSVRFQTEKPDTRKRTTLLERTQGKIPLLPLLKGKNPNWN